MKINYGEEIDSQIPSLNFLQKLGWKYVTRENAEKARSGILSNVILEDILEERLAAINSFEYKGEHHPFSNSNIHAAINALKNIPDEGLVQTNEKIYDLLTLGKSYTETVQGDRKSFTLKYIDWENLDNNHYHITEEFQIEGSKENRRPDLVLFVNGIPFVIIENKRRDKNFSIDEAISQHIRNQRKGEGTPRLFHYAQLLLAVQPNEVKYGATGTPAKFWSIWKEDVEKKVQNIISREVKNIPAEDRLPTEQDRALYSLCEPKRLMDLIYKYIVFDGPDKKICRYQQYFAVQDTLKRVTQFDNEGKRKGGVIYHTTGSGKSLTMVMLSKALALEESIVDPRVIIVTDRISLDKQIYKTFVNCGKAVKKAKSGSDLVELVKDKGNEIITTILDKFESAIKRGGFKDDSENIFVLVDESHRSQYGSAGTNMRKMLPNATYIGFTGTPLLKTEKNTARKFGGFIHSYSINQAVKDGAVLPLLYEGRATKLSINKAKIDKGFERLSTPLSEAAQKDLKKKFATISKIYESENIIEEIAHDISEHFCKNWKGTGFKAQLAVPKIDVAVKYQKFFESQTDPNLKINTKVIFTPPDSRKDNEDVWKETSNESRKYWDSLMEKHRSKEAYETWVVDKFKEETDEVELIIVVYKLLTGFDAPRNTVLYLAKPLHSHNLLQAIARVNRLFSGKEYGHIIDYVGILGKLDEALTTYSALDEFDSEDLLGALVDATEEVRKVPVRHAEVWDIFKGVNKEDIEALERHLGDKDIRDSFYDRVSSYARVLQTALGSDEFYKEFKDSQIEFYKKELKRFQSLRKSVQARYAEVVDYKEYEPRVRKLLDTYVDVDEINVIASDINIFNKEQVEKALEDSGKTAASKADHIANNMKKVISQNMEKDEAFYKKFSEMIEETIKAFREDRLSEAEYLEKVLNIRDDLDKGYQDGIPDQLRTYPEARAFFGAVSDVLITKHGKEPIKKISSELAGAGISIAGIVENLTIRDWHKNLDVQRQMENEIEDYLIDHRKSLGVEMTFDEIDEILSKCLKVAKNNY